MATVDRATAASVKKRLAARLADYPAVSGIGLKPLGKGSYALKVDLLREAPELDLPAQFDGVDLDVEVTGPGFPQAL